MSDQSRQQQSASAWKPLDPDQDRERLEPGLDTAGKGEAGADPARIKSAENSNT